MVTERMFDGCVGYFFILELEGSVRWTACSCGMKELRGVDFRTSFYRKLFPLIHASQACAMAFK